MSLSQRRHGSEQGTWYLDQHINHHTTPFGNLFEPHYLEPEDVVILSLLNNRSGPGGGQILHELKLTHVQLDLRRSSSKVSWPRLRALGYTKSEPYNRGTVIDVRDRNGELAFHCDRVGRGSQNSPVKWKVRLWEDRLW